MKSTGMGGATTVTASGNTVTVSTTNLLDYRRLLRRLTDTYRTVNDATHAEFAIDKTDAGLSLRLRKALEGPEVRAYERFITIKRMVNERAIVTDSAGVVLA